jgi:hypothetical protein
LSILLSLSFLSFFFFFNGEVAQGPGELRGIRRIKGRSSCSRGSHEERIRGRLINQQEMAEEDLRSESEEEFSEVQDQKSDEESERV